MPQIETLGPYQHRLRWQVIGAIDRALEDQQRRGTI